MISVVIPVYNAQDTIDACIESIFDYNKSEIEVIAINDGSKDESLNHLHALEKKYPNLHVFDQENQGNSLTRDRGIQETSGEYIMFVDADDVIVEHGIDKIQKKLNELNPDLMYFGFKTNYVEEGYSIESRVNDHVFERSFDAVDSMLMYGGFNLLWNKVYKASLIRGYHDFPIMKTTGQDFIFNCNVFPRLKRVVSIDEVLYCYLKRAKETMVTRYVKDGYGNLERKQNALIHMFDQYDKERSQSYKDYMIREYEVYLINMFAKDSPLTKNERIFEVQQNILNNEAFALIQEANPVGKYTELFKKTVLSHDARHIVNTYGLLCGFRDTCGPIYRRIRKLINS